MISFDYARADASRESHELLKLLQSGVVRPDEFGPLLFGACWNPSRYVKDLHVHLNSGETLREHIESTKAGWNPDWLLSPDVGMKAYDASGAALEGLDTEAWKVGPIRWSPRLVLPKVDDQTKDNEKPETAKRRRRLAGEVYLLSAFRRAMKQYGHLKNWTEPPAGQISPQHAVLASRIPSAYILATT